jgi:hypothetical protein
MRAPVQTTCIGMVVFADRVPAHHRHSDLQRDPERTDHAPPVAIGGVPGKGGHIQIYASQKA